ncbi:MAG: arginase [Micromonosporaceae bacterium]|nr:arginase [Micromonosporaceae bacterium]
MLGVTVLEVPQWQGSGSRGAYRLRQGASVLAGLFPAGQRVRVDTDGQPADPRDGVAALDTLAANLSAVRAAHANARASGRAVVTVGGDCGVDLAPVEAALAAHGEGLTVVWFDAHGDLNTPASSPSGAFHGMVLRALLGDGPRELAPARALRPDQVVLAGVRALDPGERAFVAEHRIRHVAAAGLANPSVLVDEVAATGAGAVYLHIDLDVLDPEVFGAVGTPEPGGLTLEQLIIAVRDLASRFTIAGLCLAEYEPQDDGDREVLTSLITALASVMDDGAAHGTAQEVERLAARAWPATLTAIRGGWLLRHTPCVTRRRSNSAAPLAARGDPHHGIEAVESFYRSRGLPVLVQVAPAHHHAGLDAVLAARGYRLAAPTLVLTAPTADVVTATAMGDAGAVHIDAVATADWLAAYVALDGHDDSTTVAELVLPRVPGPAAYAGLTVDGKVAAMGLFVAEAGWAGVFCMATDRRHRRRGYARAVLRAGARWAVTHGVERLYLQVEAGNEAARGLYERAGFTHSHTYHYRVAGSGAAPRERGGHRHPA